MVKTLNFWKDKNVLVTGHTGFKGTWLVNLLTQLGAKVSGYSLKNELDYGFYHKTKTNQKINSFYGNICDKNSLKSFMDQVNPEIIFHLAAQPLVRLSYIDPVDTYNTNVVGLANILNISRETKSLKVFLNITSDKCYENFEWDWPYRENDLMGGHDPYSNSKGCAELLTKAFRMSFFNPDNYNKEHNICLSTARAGNVIGGGDWAQDRIIPDLIKSLIEGKKLEIRSPNAIRPWQFVLEPLRGYLTLAEFMYEDGLNFSGSWNFGPDNKDNITVEEMINMLSKHLNINDFYQIIESSRYHEAKLLKLDISKAKNTLGWKPILNMNETLKFVAEWYIGFINNDNVDDLTNKQINDYISLIES